MTGAEMERAIEFLLQGQANLEGQIAETNRIVQLNAETQTEFIRFVTAHLEAQREINESLRAGNESLRAAVRELAAGQSELAAGQRRTDARIDRLADTVNRFISGRGSGNGEGGQ